MLGGPEPTVHVGKAWRLMLLDLGLDQQAILRRLGFPKETFDGEGTRISLNDFYRLWDVFSEEANDPGLALKIGQIASVEFFDPAFFAAICSPDMNTAAQRLGEFKRLVGAFSLDVEVTDETTKVGFRCKYRPDMPLVMGLTEVVFLVSFMRRATRHPVNPIRVEVTSPLSESGDYEAWFRCPISVGRYPSLTLTATDACRPFLTHDEQIWKTFEPSLRRRMDAAQAEATTRARVEQALLELLPSGRTQIEEVARELALGKRSLQRRLFEEGTTWLEVLNSTRERLARHYLSSTQLAPTEVSFLLGFEDPNSLFRAFQRWTGTTPEAWREMHRAPVRAEA